MTLTCTYVYACRSGCATSEDMLWKLEALCKFIEDLHWPDPELAAHVDTRLRAMSAEMIQAASLKCRIFSLLPTRLVLEFTLYGCLFCSLANALFYSTSVFMIHTARISADVLCYSSYTVSGVIEYLQVEFCCFREF